MPGRTAKPYLETVIVRRRYWASVLITGLQHRKASMSSYDFASVFSCFDETISADWLTAAVCDQHEVAE